MRCYIRKARRVSERSGTATDIPTERLPTRKESLLCDCTKRLRKAPMSERFPRRYCNYIKKIIPGHASLTWAGAISMVRAAFKGVRGVFRSGCWSFAGVDADE